MKNIVMSLGIIVFVGAVVAGATGAFFNDTETSTGNVFAAGAIDLQIDNESYVTDINGDLVASPDTSWAPADLDDGNGPGPNGAYLFFNFNDVKPGDVGEDTISLHVSNNDAYICAAAQVTLDSDVDYTEPEIADDPTVDLNNATGTDGELAENLEFAFWADDGDNVLEDDEVAGIFVAGTIADLGSMGQIALADSQNNIWSTTTGPVAPGQTLYVAKAWCFGDLSADPVTQDGLPGGNNNGPLDRGTGVACDGAPQATNAAQTDRVEGDLEFYAVQSRHNDSFLCDVDYTPSWELI